MLKIAQAMQIAVQHHAAGQLPQAEQYCRQVLRVDPGHVGAMHLLGLLAHQVGRSDLAIQHINEVLRLKPNYAEAHNSLGMALAKQGKLTAAATCYQQALRLKPDFAEAHNNLANLFRRDGKLEEAVAGYQRALGLKPNYAEAHHNLGVALLEQKNVGQAVACFERALCLKPDYADAQSSLGVALLQQGKVEQAVAWHHRALQIGPDIAESHNNLGMAPFEQGKLAEAEACYRKALGLKPGYSGAGNNLGVLLADQGRLAEAVACHQEALLAQPDHAEVHTNLAYAYYLQGDFESGWSEYEWRWKCRECAPPAFPPPYWDGSGLDDKTILLFSEQGLGDTIQFIRYASLVKQSGATVIVQCQPSMQRLLASCAGIDQIVPKDADPTGSDVRVPLMSLPRIFRTTLENIPAPIPYLSADSELRSRWQQSLSGIGGFKVGIAWQGNPDHRRDRQRSAPLLTFAPLAKVPGVRLVSLQKGTAREQLRELADCLQVLDLTDEMKDFADTAALLSNLDLVIAVDTAVAHLAGAMGIPVWVAIPFLPEWRWLLKREDSPWYPTMRLFRQSCWGDWAGVFERLTESLRQTVAATHGPAGNATPLGQASQHDSGFATGALQPADDRVL